MLDIESNRASKKYSNKVNLLRILWSIFRPFFYLSPKFLFGWRVFLLKLFGSKIGKNVHIYPSADIYFPWNLEIGDFSAIGHKTIIYNLGKIKIGSRVTISQYSHLCAGSHDYDDNKMTLLKSNITIEDDAWICANAILGPGTQIGKSSIVGIGAVVTKSISNNCIYAGNPAIKIKDRI